MSGPIHSWARALGGDVNGRSVLAPGPGHSAGDRSLSVTPDANAPDGFLVNSFAGDDPIACKDYVRKRLGMPAFAPQAPAGERQRAQQPNKTYFDYHDAHGAVVYQVERTDYYDGRKKKFRQRRPDPARPGEWLWKVVGHVQPVLYRLPELIEAAGKENLIVIVEGERKADLLRGWGIAATCNSGGHGSVKDWAGHAWTFKPGDNVVILPDNDKAGHDHASAVAGYLKQVQVYARILDLPGLGPKGDVIDWADAGGTAEQLFALIENEARPWVLSNGHDPAPVVCTGAVEGADVARFRATVFFTIIEMASGIMPEQIEWLWKRWLARGKLHLIAGRPGAGKSQIALSFAATISSGERWPDGTRAPAGNVLIWTSEDGIADTVIPRLTRMGADLTRVGIIRKQKEASGKVRPFNPATDMAELMGKARNMGDVALLILDPIVAAVPITKDSHKNAETRSGMQPVIDFAEATNCAVIGITHFTKGTSGEDTTERVTGSLAFGALARIIMAASKCEGEDSPAPRVLVLAKNNIEKDGGGFGYDIEEGPMSYERPDFIATRILWLEAIEGDARAVLKKAESAESDTKAETKVEQAKRFLKDALAHGKKRQPVIEAEAKGAGISADALKRASSLKEGIVVKLKDGYGGWYWGLA